MHCPFCVSESTRVIDSRPAEQGTAIRRRRVCSDCGNRFTTYERAEPQLVVQKRSGRLEPFRVDKLRTGVERALADRAVSDEAFEQLIAGIEEDVRAAGPRVTSDLIGRSVLRRLRGVDEVAYLRFASVYKEFQGARDFEREMAAMESEAADG